MRSGKGSLYEGGIRIPLIIKIPGVSKPGTMCNLPVITNDFYPTFCEIAGINSGTQNSDGLNLLSVIQHPNVKLPRESLFWHYPHYYITTTPVSAVRLNEWKLLKYYENDKVELFNIEDDISESNDLSKENPEITEKMLKKLEQWLHETQASLPVSNVNNLKE